jgi:hypothetical protein
MEQCILPVLEAYSISPGTRCLFRHALVYNCGAPASGFSA